MKRKELLAIVAAFVAFVTLSLSPAYAQLESARSGDPQNTQAWHIYTNAALSQLSPLRLTYALRMGWMYDQKGERVYVYLSAGAASRLRAQGLSVNAPIFNPAHKSAEQDISRVPAIVVALAWESLPLPETYRALQNASVVVESASQLYRLKQRATNAPENHRR